MFTPSWKNCRFQSMDIDEVDDDMQSFPTLSDEQYAKFKLEPGAIKPMINSVHDKKIS